MSEAIPLTITLSSLPPSWSGNIHEYDATIPGRIVITAQQAISLFRSGSTEPTSDEGLWFDTTVAQWKYYDYDTGSYVAANVPQVNLKYAVSATAPDHDDYLVWVVLDTNGQGEDLRTYYNGAWRSVILGDEHAIAVFGTDGEGLESLALGTAGQVLMSNGAGAQPSFQTHDSNPVGTVIMRAVSTTPTGYLPCEGGAYNRTAYATLNALLSAEGYPYGNGDGVNTFNVPDLRGRVPMGSGTGTAADATAHALGDEAGTETHTLLSAEMPAHTHSVTIYKKTGGDTGSGAQNIYGDSTVGPLAAITTSSTGSSGAHNNLQPYGVFRFFIKT